MIDHKKMYAETEKWLKEVRMDFDPKAQLGTLSIGQMPVRGDRKSGIPAGEGRDL